MVTQGGLAGLAQLLKDLLPRNGDRGEQLEDRLAGVAQSGAVSSSASSFLSEIGLAVVVRTLRLVVFWCCVCSNEGGNEGGGGGSVGSAQKGEGGESKTSSKAAGVGNGGADPDEMTRARRRLYNTHATRFALPGGWDKNALSALDPSADVPSDLSAADLPGTTRGGSRAGGIDDGGKSGVAGESGVVGEVAAWASVAGGGETRRMMNTARRHMNTTGLTLASLSDLLLSAANILPAMAGRSVPVRGAVEGGVGGAVGGEAKGDVKGHSSPWLAQVLEDVLNAALSILMSDAKARSSFATGPSGAAGAAGAAGAVGGDGEDGGDGTDGTDLLYRLVDQLWTDRDERVRRIVQGFLEEVCLMPEAVPSAFLSPASPASSPASSLASPPAPPSIVLRRAVLDATEDRLQRILTGGGTTAEEGERRQRPQRRQRRQSTLAVQCPRPPPRLPTCHHMRLSKGRERHRPGGVDGAATEHGGCHRGRAKRMDQDPGIVQPGVQMGVQR